MEKLINLKMSRMAWGQTLLAAAVFSIVGALVLEALDLVSNDLGPLPFVGAVLFVKLGLFTFWPVISKKGSEASTILHGVLPAGITERLTDAFAEAVSPPSSSKLLGAPARSSSRLSPSKRLSLWSQNDPRLDTALFTANVPTFVLNHEQLILDWNPAFSLVFGGCAGVRRGAHVSGWFEHLDNFRRVSKRHEKLYGEGILPITDRERASFVSPRWGRMVFTKIMTPIIDRGSGRIIGWNVVLNINSVNKRQDFFEHLYANIAAETRRIRHAVSFDFVVGKYRGYRALLAEHADACAGATRVLELGAGTGNLSYKLLRDGKNVTAVDSDTQLLRKLRDKVDMLQAAPGAGRAKIVRRDVDELSALPQSRYDAVSLMLLGHKLQDLGETLRLIKEALRPGGVVSLSGVLPDFALNDLFNDVRSYHEARGEAGGFDVLKHQFQHVLEHEQAQALNAPWKARAREDLRAALIENGFDIILERHEHWDGKVLFLKARKL